MKYGYIRHKPTGLFINFHYNGNTYAETDVYEGTMFDEIRSNIILSKTQPIGALVKKTGTVEEMYYHDLFEKSDLEFVECEIILK